MAARSQILSLYHKLLREGDKFHNYNFREYAIRRTKHGFRANKGENDPEKIKLLLGEAERALVMMQRQAMLGNAFSHESVMNKEFTTRSHPKT
ncbi:LYR motif-containing protein 4B-like [Watersipora subatra]|uniref:LYR motif-containing protein 4B-like n=1 Tax=Watersipora subatra TaxID=2589382 RepID=UPI00355AE324